MFDIIPRENEHFETMNAVLDLYLRGNKNPSIIAKQIKMQRKDVLLYIEEWQKIAQNSDYAKGRAAEAIVALDKHFDMIIQEQWAIVNDVETDNRVKGTTLKQIAEVEAKRQETLQKSGLYDDAGITDEIVLAQDRAEKMKQILVTLARENPELKMRILSILSSIEDEVVSIPSDTKYMPGVVPGEVTE